METVEACLRIIWKCRKEGKLAFWALENPRGFLRQFLGRPHFTFEHWQYDPNAQMYKPTDIWGYFNEPKPICSDRPKIKLQNSNVGRHQCAAYSRRTTSCGVMMWQTELCPPEYQHMKLDRAAIRAITPRGFADAFYKANK